MHTRTRRLSVQSAAEADLYLPRAAARAQIEAHLRSTRYMRRTRSICYYKKMSKLVAGKISLQCRNYQQRARCVHERKAARECRPSPPAPQEIIGEYIADNDWAIIHRYVFRVKEQRARRARPPLSLSALANPAPLDGWSVGRRRSPPIMPMGLKIAPRHGLVTASAGPVRSPPSARGYTAPPAARCANNTEQARWAEDRATE